jgi:tetratricopeptide (TPR) repeat protein
MGPLGRVLRSIDRTPRAKRRFNLLREEPPTPPRRQRGRSVLSPFVLSAIIPLAGIWQIQSDLDPLLAKNQVSSQAINESGAALPASSPEDLRAGEESEPLDYRPSPPPHLSARGGRDGGVLPIKDTPADASGVAAVPSKGGADRDSGKTGVRKGLQTERRTRPVRTREEALFRKAQEYHRGGNLEMAAELYRQVLRENPDHRDALFQLSSIYMQKSAYAEAYPLLLELVNRDPREPEALVNLAVAEIALGRHEQAIGHLDHALTLENPPRFEIYFHKGVVLSKLQRLEEAVTWYKRSEDLDPGHAPLLFNMAVTFDRLERYEEALDCYGRFLKAAGSATPRERRDVEARIGVLTAYLTEGPEPSAARGAHRTTGTEQER